MIYCQEKVLSTIDKFNLDTLPRTILLEGQKGSGRHMIINHIARKFNLISNFGKLMDPLADKSTQIAVLTSLVITDIIPIWILLIVLLKEFIMIVGASFLYGKDVVVYSRWYGKLATVLFYLAIVLSLILKQFNLNNIWNEVTLFIYYLAVFATIFALIMYVKDFFVF